MSKVNLIDTNYRAMTPFRILLDLDLSANALRIYGIIEQMENCTDSVFFTNTYLGKQLNITERQVRKVTKELRDKGYIAHFPVEDGKRWLWKTVKQHPRSEPFDDGELSTDGSKNDRGEGSKNDRGEGSFHDPHNIQNTNIQNTTTENIVAEDKLSSSSSSVASQGGGEVVISKEIDNLLLKANEGCIMHAKNPKEFLCWCKFFMEHICAAPDQPGKIRVLMSLMKKSGLTMPKGYVEHINTKPVYVHEKPVYVHEMTKTEHVKDKSVGREFLAKLQRFTVLA